MYFGNQDREKFPTNDQKKQEETEINELKKLKRRLRDAIKVLSEEADELCLKAEKQRKVEHIIKSNSLRASAKQKQEELVKIENDIAAKAKLLANT